MVGRLGRVAGNALEIRQAMSESTRSSAYDDQDYYSNELGYAFFTEFGEAIKSNPTGLADYLITFLNDSTKRNSLSNPERCRN